MRTSTRLLIALGAAALLLLYVLPLWRIDLQAPQYPEGLGLRIAIDAIYGVRPHDLQNINGLNHYIGMQPIEPTAFPELRYMPWIVAGLMAVGFAAAGLGQRRLLWAWTALLVLVAAAGLADFYRWAYEYGHDLDPRAAIQVPGMTYQPPLVGSKQLLNMRASSWPAAGGWVGISVGALALLLSVGELRRRRSALRAAAAMLFLALAACAAEPRSIAYGEDACALCRMVVSDARYGTELVRRTGRVHTFDSIECLAAFTRDSIAPDQVASLWVTDHDHPGELVEAQRAVFVHSETLPSPMGAGLSAHRDSAAARAAAAAHSGTLLDWAQVLDFVAGSWKPGAGHGHHPPATAAP